MNEYLRNFRGVEIRTKKLIAHSFLWNFRSAFKWNWLEFSEFKERQEWDDISFIDWLVSKREWKLLQRKMVEERELNITFLMDLWVNMEALFHRTKKDILLELFSIVWFSAIENKDKISCLFFWWEKLERWKFHSTKSWIFLYYNEINKYKNTEKKVNLSDALWYLSRIKCKNNLLFILTDTFNYDTLLMKQLASKNEIIFVHIFNNFENTLYLENKSILPLWSKKEWLYIDLNDENKRKEYVDIRREKLRKFSKEIIKIGGDYLYLDDTKNIFKEFFLFMKKREV